MNLPDDQPEPIVVLATQIIEDITELCTQMATINRGEILFEAEMRRAVDACGSDD